MTTAAPAESPPTRLQRVLLLVLLGHLAFGATRVPYAAYAKRWREVAEWRERGEVDYQLRLTDAETARIGAWLCAAVPPDAVVLYAGESAGYLQVLAALLAPRLLVRADTVGAQAEVAAGRPIFRGRPPWLGPGPAATPVVVGQRESFALELR